MKIVFESRNRQLAQSAQQAEQKIQARKKKVRASLADISTQLLSVGIHISKASDLGSEAELREKIHQLLSQWNQRVSRQKFSEDEIQTARLAIVAFLDEAILNSEWDGKYNWISNPLEMEIFGTNSAGVEFFDRLSKLRENPRMYKNCLEVYYLCMALGFEGKYQLENHEELRNIIAATFNILQPHVPDRALLSPNGKPKDEMVHKVKYRVPIWLVGSITLIVFLIVYLSFIVSLNSDWQEFEETIRRLL